MLFGKVFVVSYAFPFDTPFFSSKTEAGQGRLRMRRGEIRPTPGKEAGGGGVITAASPGLQGGASNYIPILAVVNLNRPRPLWYSNRCRKPLETRDMLIWASVTEHEFKLPCTQSRDNFATTHPPACRRHWAAHVHIICISERCPPPHLNAARPSSFWILEVILLCFYEELREATKAREKRPVTVALRDAQLWLRDATIADILSRVQVSWYR